MLLHGAEKLAALAASGRRALRDKVAPVRSRDDRSRLVPYLGDYFMMANLADEIFLYKKIYRFSINLSES